MTPTNTVQATPAQKAPSGQASIENLPVGMDIESILATVRNSTAGEDDNGPYTIVLTHSGDGKTGAQVCVGLETRWLAEMVGEQGAKNIVDAVRRHGSAPLYSQRLLAELAALYADELEAAPSTGDVAALFAGRDQARAASAAKRVARSAEFGEAAAKAKADFLYRLVEAGKLTVDDALKQL